MPTSLTHGCARPRACRVRTHAETLLTLLVATFATPSSAATVSPSLTPPALVLSDNLGNSVTIDSTGAVTCAGSCLTTTPAVASPGSITWAGTLGLFTIAAVAGQSKPALPSTQINLVLRASTGALGAGAGNPTLTAKWSDVGFAGTWPQTHLTASFSMVGAVSATFAGYVDNSNALFGAGMSVGAIGPATSSSSATITGAGPISEPFSMTESVTATMGANSSLTLSALNLTTVPPPLTLACTAASGPTGVAYDSHLVAGGGLPPYVFSITGVGTLPSGLALNPSTGEVSGTPTAPGTFLFIAQATDTSGNRAENTVQSQCSITITTPLAALALACPYPNDVEGVRYASTLTATGGTPPYSFFITSGSLPPGLTLNPSTGAITGTDTMAVGSFPFTAKAVDSSGNSAANAAVRDCFIVAVAAAPPPPACKLWYTTDDAKSFTIHWSLPDGATMRVLEELVRDGTKWDLDNNQGTQDVSPATGRRYGLSYELDGKKRQCPQLEIAIPACSIWAIKQGNRFRLQWSTQFATITNLDPKVSRANLTPPSGETIISPEEETTYTLSVKNRDRIYKDSSDWSKGTISLESSCSTDVSPLNCTLSVAPDEVDATAVKPATVNVTWESKDAKTAVLQRLANSRLIPPPPPNPQNNPPKSQDLKVTQTTEFVLNVTGSANEKASCRACVLNRPDKGKVLDIPPLFQRNSMWCWLTVGEMIFKYHKVPEYDPWRDLLKRAAPTLSDPDKLYQWGILSVVYPVCWLYPDACAVRGGGSWPTLQDMLKEYPRKVGKQRIESKLAPGFLTAAQIKNEIDAGRPIIVGIGFVPLTGVPLHVALIVGYVDKGGDVDLIVNDPWPYQLLKQESPYIKAGGSQNCEANYTIPRKAFETNWNGSLINIQ